MGKMLIIKGLSQSSSSGSSQSGYIPLEWLEGYWTPLGLFMGVGDMDTSGVCQDWVCTERIKVDTTKYYRLMHPDIESGMKVRIRKFTESTGSTINSQQESIEIGKIFSPGANYIAFNIPGVNSHPFISDTTMYHYESLSDVTPFRLEEIE